MPGELAYDLEPTSDDRIDQAEALVRSHCGWHIAPSKESTYTVRGEYASALLLPTLHLTEITSVTRDDEEVDAATYWWTEAGVLNGPGLGCWYGQTVVVEFTHGYEDAPADIVGVVQAIAQRAVDNPRSLLRDRTGPFESSFSQTSAGQSLALTLLDAEKAILDRYRIPGRP